jgi:hypothetical protein
MVLFDTIMSWNWYIWTNIFLGLIVLQSLYDNLQISYQSDEIKYLLRRIENLIENHETK